MAGRISGLSVAYTAAGLVLVLSGVRNDPLAATITSLLKGQVPAPHPSGPPTIGVSGSNTQQNTNSAGTTDSAIANDALKYIGHPYVYGGAPGTNGQSGWDCSSFCNWVLGHDLNFTLPGAIGSGYSGTSHGPTTLSYLAWTGASTVSNSASAAQAGDLCVWQTHMGIALGNGNMVSALNESLGTKQTTISGGSPAGELLFVRRVKANTAPLGLA